MITKNMDDEENDSKDAKKVIFDDASFDEDEKEKDVEDIERRKTRSMTDVERRELERDRVSIFWLKMENTECFDNIAIYTVEVPVRKHKKVEVMEAKERELDDLMKYGVF